jgi:radical SAM protein (TIGR01212 family)
MKRYNDFNTYLQQRFHSKVFKISLNAGFTCPNIDGTVATGGCTFCSYLGSGDFAGNKYDPLPVQFNKVKTKMESKWQGKYIVYFQANTNTHAPLYKLQALFDEAITLDPNIVAISIATRPDSLDPFKINYLKQLNKKMPVIIELGLQTIHEETSKLINRAHSLQALDDSVYELHQAGLEVVVHIINGLPGESKAMMLDTIRHLNTLPIQGIKIHMLHVMDKTKMGYQFKKNPWDLLSLESYVDITTDQIGLLREDIIIHRLTGDSPKDMLLGPLWTLKKFVVLNEIDKTLIKKGYHQGCLYEKSIIAS